LYSLLIALLMSLQYAVLLSSVALGANACLACFLTTLPYRVSHPQQQATNHSPEQY
jgi:hypothetical protein